MQSGDLIKMYGHPGFYGMLLEPVKSNYHGKWWSVIWESGYISDLNEDLMEVAQ